MNERLSEIKARLSAITPGKWILMPELCGPDGQMVCQEESGGPICDVGDPYPRGDNRPQENMEFIANAPDDMRYLTAEIARLREALGWYADSGNWSGHWSNDEEPDSDCEWVNSAALTDFGRRAREVLEVTE